MPLDYGYNFATHSYNTAPQTGNLVPAAPAPTASSALPSYNINPAPQSGSGPYGSVPGSISIPPSAYQQTIAVAPGLGNTDQLTSNIMSELQGDISPQALKNMQDAAASYGVSSGMPGSNAIPGTLAFNKNLRNIGLDTQAVQRQGQQDYLSALKGIGSTQTSQSLAAEIAAHNAQLAAAPNPSQAAAAQLQAYLSALNAYQRGPGGGTGGGLGLPSGGSGTGAYSAPFTGGTPALGTGTGGIQDPFSTNFGLSTPSGSGFSWAGTAPTDLFGDLLGGAGGTSYDQSSSPDMSLYNQAYQNPEDYYAGILAGGY